MLWYFCISTRIQAQNRGELNERTICKYVGKVASLKGGRMESHVPYETEARKPFLESAERVSESKVGRALAATVGSAPAGTYSLVQSSTTLIALGEEVQET